jgi:phospholipid-transporting ATPase
VFENGFSGQTIFESWTLTFYNVIFTFFPPFAIGVFDQFVSARLLDRYPQLYMIGQRGEWFSIRTFWAWIVNGFYHSAIGYVASVYFFINDGIQSNGQTSGHWVWGTTLYTAMLITVLGKAALITKYSPYSALLLRRLTCKFVD